MKNFNWADVPAASDDFARPVPGGYICRILEVEDFPNKEYLKIHYDIVEGEFADFYKKRHDALNADYPAFIRSYKETARSMFKGFLMALQESNRNFLADRFNGNEQQFVGMLVGLVMGEEEYLNTNNEIRLAIKAKKVTSCVKIKNGDFKVPALKKYEGDKPLASNAGYQPATAPVSGGYEDVPF